MTYPALGKNKTTKPKCIATSAILLLKPVLLHHSIEMTCLALGDI